MPFDGAFHTDTIRRKGGLWLLWDSDRVEVSHLASTEQEIHSTIKVRASNFSWMLSAVYASPRSAELALRIFVLLTRGSQEIGLGISKVE